MKLPTITLLALVALSSGSALPEPIENNQDGLELVKRTPSDRSGNSQMVFDCNAETLPSPGGAGGAGEGGSSQFSDSLLLVAKGKQIGLAACHKEDEFCSNCLMAGGGLSSATNVSACWFPLGGDKGCSIEFKYNGYHYDSNAKEKKCGHVDKFEAFSDGLKALCYFDI